MKIADMIAESHERTITSQELNQLRTSGDAKRVYHLLERGWDSNNGRDGSYDFVADTILSAVAKNSTGFVVDIANRFRDVSNRYEMSQKQTWCVAFAFLKISTELDTNTL